MTEFVEVDSQNYFLCAAPFATGDEPNVAPHTAADGTKPDSMRKPRYVNESWVDEEAAQLAAELAEQSANIRRQEINVRLQEIDLESVRALRSQKIGRGSQPDIDRLNVLEDEAESLRAELSAM